MRSRKSIMFSSFQAVRYSIMIHWKTTRSEAYTIAEQPSSSYTVALQEIGIRDFPNQMGAHAPMHPPAPPNSISYAGNASGAPASANFEPEARFGIEFLMKMWDDTTKALYYQVGNSQDWANFPGLLSDYDIWRLPQADDDRQGCPSAAHYICHRPVFVAGPAGSPLSPNLARPGRGVCRVLPTGTHVASGLRQSVSQKRGAYLRAGGHVLCGPGGFCRQRHVQLRVPAHDHAV